MSTGNDGTAQPSRTATTSLRLLEQNLTAMRGRPAGPSGRTRSPHGAPAVDLGILDHMTRSRDELVSHVRAATPAPVTLGAVPREEAAVYQWCEDNSAHLDAAARQAAEVIMVRQALEHALMAGDRLAVRKMRCPSCRCFGMLWMAGAAVCINDRDLDDNRRPRAFTLRALAQFAVQEAAEKSAMRAAT